MNRILFRIALVAIIGFVVYLWKTRHVDEFDEPLALNNADTDEPSASIVLLLSKPCSFEEPYLRAMLSKAFAADFSTDTDSTFMLPVVEKAQYMVKYIDTIFLLHNRASPYFPDSDAVARAIEGDDTLADNVSTHTAWLSFDSLGSDERSTSEQYDLIGAVLAELAPEETIALFVVEKGILIRFDSERKKQLKGPNTLQKLGFE